jgi:hypothetical protein
VDSIKIIPDADLLNMSMAEISLRYDHENDSRVKEERTGVKKRGNPEALFYISLTEGDFNYITILSGQEYYRRFHFCLPLVIAGLPHTDIKSPTFNMRVEKRYIPSA